MLSFNGNITLNMKPNLRQDVCTGNTYIAHCANPVQPFKFIFFSVRPNEKISVLRV